MINFLSSHSDDQHLVGHKGYFRISSLIKNIDILILN